MQLEQPERGAYKLISGYGTGRIGVDGVDYADNVIITRTRVIERWHVGDDPAAIAADDFGALFDPPPGEERVEILLLGTGAEHDFAPMRLMGPLAEMGIALEVMSTRAACRTYSVLVDESRPVAAALLQIRG